MTIFKTVDDVVTGILATRYQGNKLHLQLKWVWKVDASEIINCRGDGSETNLQLESGRLKSGYKHSQMCNTLQEILGDAMAIGNIPLKKKNGEILTPKIISETGN